MAVERNVVVWVVLAVGAAAFGGTGEVDVGDANVHLRGAFENARIRFEREGRGHVAFLGGSITEMDGYRPRVMEILERRFSQTQFTFTDAGVSSTCSTTGAFRLADDVLSAGPVDLFFVEFAVNDDQDARHGRRECVRGMEGIVRHVRRHNPSSDIVIVYFVNPEMLETWQAGEAPLSAAAHNEIARHYAIATINLAKEVADRIGAGTFTWQEYGGTHPGPAGNALCAAMIERLMAMAWGKPLSDDAKAVAHLMPELLDAKSYWNGRLVGPERARIVREMRVEVPEWSKIAGHCRGRFVDMRLLCAETPGAAMTLAFEGTAIGAYVLAGPDAGMVEVAIDGGPSKKVNLFHPFSMQLHYPRTVMFDADLEPGEHTLALQVSAERDPNSSGHAARILYFTENPGAESR